MLSKQTYYDAQRITAPVLHLYNPGDTYTDLTWFDNINKTTCFLAAMKNMQHGHFTSFGLLNKAIPAIMGKTAADPGNGYEAVMFLTKEFLDNFLTANTGDTVNFFDSQKAAYSWINDCIIQTKIKPLKS